jgi:membrane protease YdiL (CAAX protease family)
MNVFDMKDDSFSKSLALLIGIGLLVVALFLNANAELPDKDVWYFLVMAGVITIFAFIDEISVMFNAMFFGNRDKTIIGFIAGIVLGLVLSSNAIKGAFGIILPVASIKFGDLNFFYVNVLAPPIEELFFRAILFPLISIIIINLLNLRTRNQMIAGFIIGAFITSGIFSIYHINAYSIQAIQTKFAGITTSDLITSAFILSLLWIGGNLFFGTIAFSLGWHLVNNFSAMGVATDSIILTFLFYCGLLLVAYIINKNLRKLFGW